MSQPCLGPHMTLAPRMAIVAMATLAVSMPLRRALGQPAASPGERLIQQMHDRYAGRWFRTLTFQQSTTVTRNDSTVVTTWYESVRAPDRLRIDVGDPQLGNGMLYTADSSIVLRGGRVVRALPEGNPFLPFVVGVYTQPVATTLAQLRPWQFDLSKAHDDMFDGARVVVVGAERGDTIHPQFWVSRDRLLLVRMIVPLGADTYDIALRKYAEFAGSWVAMRIEMASGQMKQSEDYTNVRVNPDLSSNLFDPSSWTTARHWHAPGSGPR